MLAAAAPPCQGFARLGGVRKALLLLSGLLFLACPRRPGVLAEVAGRPLTVEEVRQAAERLSGRAAAEVSQELLAQVFVDLLEEDVVLAAGSAEDRALTGGQRSRRARELLAQLCPPPEAPSPAEVEEALAREGQGEVKERLFLRQLILPTRSQALEARERLINGADFFTLSRELSRSPNAASGGALGWVERGQLAPDFEAAVAGLKVGEISQPVASEAGWHLFLVEKRELGQDPARRQQLAQALTAQRVEQARRQCLLALAGKVGVKVYCQQAPFPCRNPFEEAQ